MKLAWDAKTRVDRSDGRYHRERSDDLYHSARWTRLSKAFRADPKNVLCRQCLAKGIIREAEVVDHIIPWPVCKDFFDRANLQPLCRQCNDEKGQRDKSIIAQWRKVNSINTKGL